MLDADLAAPDAVPALLAIVEQAPMGMLLLDGDGSVAFANRHALRLLGDATPGALLAARVAGPLAHALDALRTGGTPFTGVEGRLVAEAGAGPWLAASGTVVRDGDGAAAVVTLADVTAQKAAEATLDHARRVAERAAATRMAFLRLMSHELRTPLGAIRGFAELLAEEVAALPDAPPEAAEFADTIREAADRALHLVSSLLDLSRLETGALDLAAMPVCLAAVARAVAARHAGRVVPGVRLTVDAPDEALAVGDPVRVESLADALVANAAAFTPAGEIHLTVDRVADGVRLTVRDTGVGMAADFAEGLFEPFAQEDTRVARGHEGAGLSLAIAHRLAAQMGGSLTVATAPGEGSAFTVTLPAAV